jgi:hypothetical protein
VNQGIENGKIRITGDLLKGMEFITRDTETINSKGKKTKHSAKGVLLDGILAKYGKSQKNCAGIRFASVDGYSIVVPEEVLKKRDILLSYDDLIFKPVKAPEKPLRVIVPDERSIYWVRNLTTIELLQHEGMADTTGVVFLDTAVETVVSYDYEYYNSSDKAVKAGDLTAKFIENETTGEAVLVKAADGFEKNEKLDIFQKGFIKYTGVDAPAFVAPDMPKGMHIKNIKCFLIGKTVFC